MAVAEELHFRKAAEKLFISQPGLSRQIRLMEESLEVKLFNRTKKKVSLTPAGHYLKEEVEFLLNHLELTKEQLRQISSGQSGTIRIGFLGSAMQSVVPDFLLKLKEQYPKIHASLEELSNGSQVNAVLRDRLDIGFVRLARVPKPLKIHPVYEGTFSIVLPMTHPLNADNFKGMHQLSEEDFILFDQNYSPQYFDTVMSICEDAGFSPRVSHKSVHAQTIFKLVENQMGIAIVPTALQQGFQMKVKFITLSGIRQRAVLSVIWKSGNRNRVLKHCMDLILNKNLSS